MGPFPGWLRVCLGLSGGAFGSGWAWGPLISWAHCHPVAVSSGVGAGGGSGRMGLAVACVHPTEAWLSGSTGYRTPASLGKRARPGWAAPGVSQYPPHPLPLLGFYHKPPNPPASSPFSASWCVTYFWSWKETWKSILLPLPHYQSRAPFHPPNPHPLPWVLTPEGLGKRLQEVCAAILLKLVPHG